MVARSSAPRKYERPAEGTQTCATCKAEKSVDEFSTQKRSRTGLQSSCRACHKAYAREHYAKNKERYRENRIRLREEHPAIRAAHRQVEYAIEAGRLEKQPCEVCRSQDSEAHHDDYAKPLDVRWLCRSHHSAWHAEHGPGLNAEGEVGSDA